MGDIKITRAKDVPAKHKSEHEGYEYSKREIVPRGLAGQCVVSVYELPPGKSAYPYHFHTKNEEVFYIISGQGVLRTPAGAREVSAGDFLYFPANEKGAHKLMNASETEALIYIDFDTSNDLDVAFYPDSGKVGIWGKGIGQLFRLDSQVDYYDGE